MFENIGKDRIIAFLLGTIVGIFMTFIFLGGVYAVYKVGKKIVNFWETKEVKLPPSKPRIKKRIISIKNFNLGFEDKQDLEFFDLNDGLYVERSKDFVTQGKHSLLAEFPKGATYPGLSWEVYRMDKCLDWSRGKYFSFDVYNNSEINVILNVKLKSGPNYPKKVYETQINLPPQKIKRVKISIDDLGDKLNVREISYVKLFIDRPQETIILYFDNIRVE